MGQNGYRIQLLAPAQAGPLLSNAPIAVNPQLHQHYLSSLQRLRAAAYLEDSAIEPRQVDGSGRFWMEGDEESWHFLLVDDHERAVACLRLLLHPNTVPFERLRLTRSSLAADPLWSTKLRLAVESDLIEARRANIGYAELGGWAITPEYRCGKAALETLLASYAWGQMIGGCLSSCTATIRHRSAVILRRIGGKSLYLNGEPIPPYTDPRYGCLMEILRFDSREIDPRFAGLVEETRQKLATSCIIRPGLSASEELTEDLAVRQSLIALGAATRKQAHIFQHPEFRLASDTAHVT